jgi:hypothetical protein
LLLLYCDSPSPASNHQSLVRRQPTSLYTTMSHMSPLPASE